MRETFERIVRLYERENPETYKELRKLELDYETKRGQLSLYFDSVKVCWKLHDSFGGWGSSVYNNSCRNERYIVCTFSYRLVCTLLGCKKILKVRIMNILGETPKPITSLLFVLSLIASDVCSITLFILCCALCLLCCVTFPLFQNAELVEVDSIPLPDMPHAPSSIHIQDIPLPGAQPPSILKKSSTFG